MQVVIDIMEIEHIEQVAQLESRCFSMPWSVNAFKDAVLSKDYKYIVALCGDKVVGYAGMQHVLDEAEITNIAVDDDFRQMGIATKLLEGLCKLCEELEVIYLHLEVRESNTPAKKLYVKNGFNIDGIRKNFYQKPQENAVLMTKICG